MGRDHERAPQGHFCISSHAVHYWRDQSKAGKAVNARIINTTSGAGLQGSIGQSNYAAAKAGIAALTLNRAAELGRYGITANAVAPAARTGMTTAVESMAARMAAPDDGSFDYWAPENVSSLLARLASEEAAHITGRVFESEGGKISIADGWRTTQGVDKGIAGSRLKWARRCRHCWPPKCRRRRCTAARGGFSADHGGRFMRPRVFLAGRICRIARTRPF